MPHSTDRKLYQKVANAIVASIQSGLYPPGERLPPERELAEKLDVSRPTIREALIALEIRGIVEARRGSGIYVIQSAPTQSQHTAQPLGTACTRQRPSCQHEQRCCPDSVCLATVAEATS